MHSSVGRFYSASILRCITVGPTLLAVSICMMPSRLVASDLEKVNKLASQCRLGKQKACSELAKIAADDKNPSIRQAAAQKIKEGLVTDLVNAATLGDAATVKSLLARGVAVDSKNQDGKTALISASQNGRADVVRLLLDRGANVNPAGNDRTPLMWASQNGRTEVVRVLLEADADVSAKNVNPDYVRMPDGAIAYPGPTATVSSILSQFPGSTLVHGDVETALSLASKNAHPDIVDLLTRAAAVQAVAADADIVISEVRPGVYKMRVQKQTQIGQIGVGPSGPTFSMAAAYLSKKVAFTGDMTSFVGAATPDRRSRTINVAALTYDPSRQNNPPLAQLGLVELNESGIVKSDNAKTGWVNWVARLTFNDAGRTRTIELEDINFWVNRGGENWLSFSFAKAHEVRSDGTAGPDVPVTTKLQQDGHNGTVTLLVEDKYAFHPLIKDSQTMTFTALSRNL